MLALITPTTTGFGGRALSAFGLLVLVFIAWLFSANRKAVNWRPVIWGIVLQIILAVVLLAPVLQDFVFAFIDGGVRKLLSFSEAGATFVFQSIEPHAVLGPDGNPITGDDGSVKVFAGVVSPPAKTFAFWILPTIVFFSSMTSVLYHWGVLQRVVKGIAWVMS
jgi:CNT family concentrative nucleoside transporter